MKKIKTFVFIGIITVAYFCGYVMGLGMSTITTKANATPNHIVNNVNNTTGQWANYEIIYVNGKSYIVFHNRTGSDIEVLKCY